MTSSGFGTDGRSGAACAECGAALATDQTYCVRCGTRRGPLPPRIAVALADIEDHGRPIVPGDPLLNDEPQPKAEPESIVSAARTGVIAVLVMLAFGVIIGGAFSPGGLTALANTIVLAVRPTVQQAAQVVTTATGGGGGGGGGGGSGGHSHGGGGGGAAGAPVTTAATVPAQAPITVTVSETHAPNTGTATTPQPTLPPIDHLWLIVLGQQGYQQAWATNSGHPYLTTLRKSGEIVHNYDAVASSELANEAALISGQGPTPQTVENCPTYASVTPGKTDKQQQVLGDGCIYPQTTQSLPQQFLSKGLSWKAYVQGIGDGSTGCSSGSSSTSTTAGSTTPTVPTSTTSSSTTTAAGCPPAGSVLGTTTSSSTSSTTSTSASPSTTPTTPTTSSTTSSSTDPIDTIGAATCPHPALNSPSLNQTVTGGSTYVNWKNPVIYFQGLLLPSGECEQNDVGIGQLAADLKNPGATPSFSYIAPDPCDDGSDTPCRPGAKAGLAQADGFLQKIVPEIERSAAYKDDGLILITFASAPQSGPHWDTSSCCGQVTAYPNLPSGSTVPSTTGTSTACDTSSSSSTSTTPSTTPTTSSSTATSSTTTPGECGPAIVGTPPGGGQVGLLMISPWIDPDKVDEVDTLNHFSLVKGVEQLFKMPNLGYARDTALQGFDPGMFATSKR
jgi:hypothetical protein